MYRLTIDSFSIKVTNGPTRTSCESHTNVAGFDGGSDIPAVSAISAHHASHRLTKHTSRPTEGMPLPTRKAGPPVRIQWQSVN